MVNLFFLNNPNGVLPLETRLAINRLGMGRNQKWHKRKRREGRKVKKKCARHNKDRYELIPLVSRRHQAQKTVSPVLIFFQNVRFLNNKMEDVVEITMKWM